MQKICAGIGYPFSSTFTLSDCNITNHQKLFLDLTYLIEILVHFERFESFKYFTKNQKSLTKNYMHITMITKTLFFSNVCHVTIIYMLLIFNHCSYIYIYKTTQVWLLRKNIEWVWSGVRVHESQRTRIFCAHTPCTPDQMSPIIFPRSHTSVAFILSQFTCW